MSNEWHNVFDKMPPDSANSVLVVAEYDACTEYNVCYVNYRGQFQSEETNEVIPAIKWQLIIESKNK